jgi:hypothetical protein
VSWHRAGSSEHAATISITPEDFGFTTPGVVVRAVDGAVGSYAKGQRFSEVLPILAVEEVHMDRYPTFAELQEMQQRALKVLLQTLEQTARV